MSDDIRCLEFASRLHRDIPLSAHMGAEVLLISPSQIRIGAPLVPNSNHKSTAFGGSVHSIAVLSCWALVATTLEDEDLKSEYVVIQSSEIDYRIPVDADFYAESSWGAPESRETFLKTLRRKGLARTELKAIVKRRGSPAEICAVLTGRFVAQVCRD